MHASAVTLTAVLGLASYAYAQDNCNDKCQGYQTWMSSCAGYEPSGSGWSSECTSFCTDNSKQKAYTDCTACLAKTQGQSQDTLNGSLNRLCAEVSKVKSLSASASKTGKDASKTDKSSASRLAASGGIVAAAGVLAALL